MADPQQLLLLARDVVEKAADLVAGARAEALGRVQTKSSPTDPVTAADRAAEQFVVEALLAARPDDGVLGEEGGARAGTSGVRWVLDPIDGTVNYLYGIPAYAVSLAAQVDGATVAGVVRNVATGEEWTALTGGGAYRDGVRLGGSGETRLDRALVGTGFAYDAARRRHQAGVLVEVLPRVRDIRRFGSAALDLCAAAEGRLDAYYEWGLSPWDLAAGELVAREAGLVVSGLRGRPAGEPLTVAAPPALHGDLHDLLAAMDADGEPSAR
ncbi:MAG TPA: inositol monophosphatase family protein [Mycobacteriales bacterium]|jgi:myo-inositol-1(or 4)-monophosphatase